MKPFEPPANANTPVSPMLYWAVWPLESCALAMEVAASQYRCWTDAQRALMAAAFGVGSRPSAESLPVVECAAADMREASAAMLRAQRDAMALFRRSA